MIHRVYITNKPDKNRPLGRTYAEIVCNPTTEITDTNASSMWTNNTCRDCVKQGIEDDNVEWCIKCDKLKSIVDKTRTFINIHCPTCEGEQ